MTKEDVTYIHNEILFGYIKNEILPFAMALTELILVELAHFDQISTKDK